MPPPETSHADAIVATQSQCTAALWNESAPLPHGLRGSARARASRFQIYRNNVVSSLVSSLEKTFPVVRRLVGREFFLAMARVYVESDPPTTPALIDYGAGFPRFLGNFEPIRDLPYLSDVAALEWLRTRSYHAADELHADTNEIAALAASDPAHLVVVFHASAHLVRSDYPIVSIWRTNNCDDEVREIDPDSAGEQGLIVRQSLEVRLISLDAGAYAFIAALNAGSTLAAAATAALAVDPAPSIPHALALLIATGAIRQIHLIP